MTPILDDRFWGKVDKDGPNGCWVWTAYIERAGYGKFHYKGRAERVYRLAYQALVGEIPEGMVIDHVCRNRACCNPEHLEIVTPRENARRGALGVLYTHCRHGHELTPENTYWANTKTGLRRNCKTCVDAGQAASYRKNPEPAKARSRAWWAEHKDEANAKRREERKHVASGKCKCGEGA